MSTESRVDYAKSGDVVSITVDHPPVNALSRDVRSGIAEAIARAGHEGAKAVIILCAGRTFIAGADISEFGKPPQQPYLPDLLNAIEACEMPVIAALHGTALGGGFELALACHYRIAAADSKVGLPEVKLGLFPGAGGTQRLPRLAGIEQAIEMMASGNPIGADTALQLGLVDRLSDEDLAADAMAYARELIADGAGPRRSSELPAPEAGAGEFDEYRKVLSKQSRGLAAPLQMLQAVEASTTMSFEDGLATERRLFLELYEGPQAAAMRHLFFAERAAAKVEGLPAAMQLRDIKAVGIVGAGTMGGGIAICFANAGFDVTLLEVNDEALQRGLAGIDRNYAGSVKRSKLTAAGAAENRARIVGSTDYADLAGADLLIEAVFEDPQLKQDIFRRLDSVCRDGAILATNTSYQDVNAIAAVTGRPQDVLGMHFFSPAHIMKLLEVVRGDRTADDVLATVMALARKIRKVPVLSGVCYGFIGNRMLQPYMREAQLCLIEGSTPQAIDDAMREWGMAMGPISVADLAGLDISYKARQALSADERGEPAEHRVADALVEAGRLGQKSGAGFYRYDPDTRRQLPDEEVMQVVEAAAAELGIERRTIEADEIVDRLLFALINEGIRIVAEGIAQRPGDIDVVYAYGYGFPAWRGGPMYHADVLGMQAVLERIEALRQRFGDARWRPAELLETLAASGKSLADWAASRPEDSVLSP